jgi:hypothetical protein
MGDQTLARSPTARGYSNALADDASAAGSGQPRKGALDDVSGVAEGRKPKYSRLAALSTIATQGG